MSDAAPGPTDPRAAGRDAFVAAAVCAVLVAGLVRINIHLPGIGHVGSALVAVLFLYAPVFMAWRRKEDLDDYGFHTQPLKKGLVTAGVALLVIVPIFALGYFAFYELACGKAPNFLTHLTPRGQCAKYGGLVALHAPALTGKLLEFIAVQLVVVALPEELFFRGFLLKMLELRFPPKRRILGGGVGLALVISSAIFAVVHLPRDGDPSALATFFPGLLFGWMRSATGSILASTITHAGSNILIHVLELIAAR